jgi:hypothetical protein
MNNKKRISILLMGGLGNQIFQLVKAQQLKELGYEVSIDTSNFKEFEKNKNQLFIHRKQVFPISYFGFNETSFLEKNLYSLFTTLGKYHLLPGPLNIVNEINDYSQLESKFLLINKAIGYWQDVELLRKYKDFIISSMKNDEVLANAFNRQLVVPGKTALHVRRGDYLNINEQLSERFYLDSISYCENNITDFSYEVFTDDYEFVSKSKVFATASKIHKSDGSNKSTLKDFSLMLDKENFIIGNSTFSLLAAILSETASSKILFAEPWYKNKNKNLNFDKNWIGIQNLF